MQQHKAGNPCEAACSHCAGNARTQSTPVWWLEPCQKMSIPKTCQDEWDLEASITTIFVIWSICQCPKHVKMNEYSEASITTNKTCFSRTSHCTKRCKPSLTWQPQCFCCKHCTFLRAPEGFLRRHPQRIGKRQFKLFNHQSRL